MGVYAAAHADPQGAADARPTALQIVQDEAVEGKLTGKVIVITGATSGIGFETARALSATGATLFLTARDLNKAKTVLEGVLEPGRVSLVSMDNNSFRSIHAAAEHILAESGNKVNILICNAGVMGVATKQLTEYGHEVHWQTNYLSHLLLFQLLKPALLSSVTTDLHSRVVIVSSSAMRSTTLPASDDYDFQRTQNTHEKAYAASKLAEVYLANNIDRRFGARGLHSTSLHPGAVNSDISRNLGPQFVAQIMSNPFVSRILKSAEQGAATTVIAAVGKEWENKGGRYLEDVEEAKRGEDDGEVFGVGWVKQTYNQQEEDRLWQDSLKAVGLPDDA